MMFEAAISQHEERLQKALAMGGAEKLQERFDVVTRWDGPVLHFNRSGVDGAIELLPGAVRVKAELGFLLSAMKGMVESEIQRVLTDKLG